MQSRASSHALAPSLLSSEGSRVLQDVVLVLLGTAFIAIAAKIKVPFFPVPMTLQTLAIMVIASTYGFRLGTLTVVAYLAEGLVGLPVFTNTPPAVAGPLYFLGPTGGFLAGFVAVAAIVGAAADKGFGRSVPKLLSAMLIGEIVMMALGFAWLASFAMLSNGAYGLGIYGALTAGVTPFVWGELLKIALAGLAVPAVWHLVGPRD